jgi:ClpX C4-type zinc finger
MQIVNIRKERSCTFCGKSSQQVARSLISSPDHRTYICDECVVEPSRLKLAPEGHENRKDAPAPSPFRLGRFFQEHFGTKQERFSFCQKRLRSRDSHLPATHPVHQVQICSDCLVVCRQILTDHAPRKHLEAR